MCVFICLFNIQSMENKSKMIVIFTLFDVFRLFCYGLHDFVVIKNVISLWLLLLDLFFLCVIYSGV